MKNNRLSLNIENMLAENIGGTGISIDELEVMQSLSDGIIDSVQAKRPSLTWMELPFNQDEAIGDILAVADGIRERFDSFVVFGIGGSALGPLAAHQMLRHMRWNELPNEKRNGPRFYVEDNVDPERMASLLDIIDIEKTCFNIVSKSGSTSETMAQFMIISKLLKEKLGSSWADNIVVTTDKQKGNLVKLAGEFGFKMLIIPDGVGGRFSQLCPVGLLPAAVCGLDIRKMLEGAADMSEVCMRKDMWQNPAFMFAALQFVSKREKKKNITVMMPYADSLKYMSDWFAQLWAESLGKEKTLSGEKIYAGQTPVKALGVTDQHSQVQLYTEGPFDKTVVFLALGKFRGDVEIPSGFNDIPGISFLGGHTLNELIEYERVATGYALTKAKRQNMTITLPEANEYYFGQLVYMLEMATAFVGEMLGINAFDQPGVEAGKNATYALMGRDGYSELAKELKEKIKHNEKYIIQ